MKPVAMRKSVFLTLLTLVTIAVVVAPIMAIESVGSNGGGEEEITLRGLGFIAASLATGLACFGAGVGLGTVCSAAIGAVAEKPEMFGLTFIYVVFVEAIAIYGLTVTFMILMML